MCGEAEERRPKRIDGSPLKFQFDCPVTFRLDDFVCDLTRRSMLYCLTQTLDPNPKHPIGILSTRGPLDK